MKLLLQICSFALTVYSAQACRTGSCKAFCAGETKDPTKKLTFYKQSDLDKFNEKYKGDEKFCVLHQGKCTYKDDCSKFAKVEICGIPETGSSGFPETFRNFCELNRYNCDHPRDEYFYYHDDCCNDLADVTPSKEDCECLECKNDWEPVCAYPCDPNGAQPVTFTNRCQLKSQNCNNPNNEFLYWHENQCYFDQHETQEDESDY